MQVKEAMTTDVELASPTHTIRQAALLMGKTDCGVLPVADKDSLVGRSRIETLPFAPSRLARVPRRWCAML